MMQKYGTLVIVLIVAVPPGWRVTGSLSKPVRQSRYRRYRTAAESIDALTAQSRVVSYAAAPASAGLL